MNNTIPTSSPTHHIHKQTDYAIEKNPHECFSDSTIITTTTQNMIIDHPYSSQISGNDDIHELTNPKTTTIKPFSRRRSRASKKTPTKIVNASIANFRALVQQHTGCHTCPMFKHQKGPINLSFGPSNDDQNELFESNSIGEGSIYNHEDQADKYSNDNLQQESATSASAGYSINSENNNLSIDDYGW